MELYPIPLASPSKKDGSGGLANANPSVLPSTMQLVMISPTKTDSCLLISYRKAFSTSSARITRVAMILISTMMRIFLGIRFRILDITRLEKATTRVRATPITMAVLSCTVTASAEQIPSICFDTGFASQSASRIIL